jgi:hypothetical protein
MLLRAKELEERGAEREAEDVPATRRDGRRHDARDVLGATRRVGVVPDLDTHVARHGGRTRRDGRVLAGGGAAEPEIDLGADPLGTDALVDVGARDVHRADDRQAVRRRIPAARAGAEGAVGGVEHRHAEARRAHAVGAAVTPGRRRRRGRVGGDRRAAVTHGGDAGVGSVERTLGARVAAGDEGDDEGEREDEGARHENLRMPESRRSRIESLLKGTLLV